MSESKRKAALDRIRDNIQTYGHHVYIVAGGPSPRFAYTVGLRDSLGLDLVFAGGLLYSADETLEIINALAEYLRASMDLPSEGIQVSALGSFTLRRVDFSWVKALLLGATDYYREREIAALQIVPDLFHFTLDVPDLGAPRQAANSPAWRWLDERWAYPVPANSAAVTNLGALRGDRITEAMRWEDDEWELFAGAGPDIPQDELRRVPLATLLALDDSLFPVVDLRVGTGLWREASDWQRWRQLGRADT